MIKEKEKDIEIEKGIEIEKDMTPILLKELGMRYPKEKSKRKYRYGLYQCQYCGKEFEVQIQNIKTGHTKSCGCQAKTNGKTHGVRSHRLYTTWAGMKNRCYNEKNQKYKDYGGRGIQICDRWLDIKNFIEDIYSTYKIGLTLDRIDVNGNYEPDNVRWTTLNVQAQNTKDIRSNNNSGFRGVSWNKKLNKWIAQISVNNKRIWLGIYPTALEAAEAYERYVRINNLEHNFTPTLTEEEIEELNKKKEENVKI